ncbi:H+transporting two-sector ATPase C (AC39) subunit [Thermovirga lienii DSM 17291]|jgi:V/A-type H+-transporting ATPase subunit C|uniref:H+transporting two-sector ATPase C (AC39) subunit n=1 Tax=Thermovirga lienii (strain ATCC BAA-1197 / DSM 17291 / Cas60314) TaxID=580340 RepID=G7V9U3_THELD|nr:V-type ATPase subunit [Thermovirga lienii]AER66643.1 H+transporting two-sector ATPase C (AC39) subunit [Thermovirga lienii DSM 17291]MDN5318408.1 V/A-type H+/Na+-transporting ATPase subunit [Thermovirga sp.]MDN5368429.1 V/A-type H+/Na+-transporting ATPase subunit [Thermovirga sp.]HCD71558.1 hypothetical protein [Thermovirga lienii]
MLLKKYEENYGYFNARLRARMEFFLKKEDYERLASGSLGEFETFIMEGQFGKNYREELLKSGYSTGRRIDEALARGVSDNFQKIKTFAVGEPRLLLELLFMRSDLHNGRLLLRALKTKSNATQPPPKWYGFGALPASLFEDLYASRSNKEIIGKLFLDGHRIATSLAKAVIELEQTGNLPQAERRYLSLLLGYALDSIEDIRAENKKIILEYIKRTVDIWNVNVFSRKIRNEGEEAAYTRYFMDTEGLINRNRLLKANKWSELLSGTPWSGVLKKVKDDVSDQFILRSLMREFLFWQVQQRRENLMGIGIAVAYVALQLAEWQNLNTISIGLQLAMPADQILSRLIILER